MMIEFVIGTTDFGIDPDSAIFEVVPLDSHSAVLTLEFESPRENYTRIQQAHSDEWGWASFPPWFYLRDYPIPWPGTSGTATVLLDREAYREYEVALYMMEHQHGGRDNYDHSWTGD